MSVRIRADGRVLCAAMHSAQTGDSYLDDGVHYELSMRGILVTELAHEVNGRGGHASHGEWWWAWQVPSDVVIDVSLTETNGDDHD